MANWDQKLVYPLVAKCQIAPRCFRGQSLNSNRHIRREGCPRTEQCWSMKLNGSPFSSSSAGYWPHSPSWAISVVSKLIGQHSLGLLEGAVEEWSSSLGGWSESSTILHSLSEASYAIYSCYRRGLFLC